MKKIKYIISACLVLIVSIFIMSNQTLNVDAEIEIIEPAKAMVVLEGNTNEVLYEFNSKTELPMASTTKIATAIVAIENCQDFDTKFTVSDKSIGIEGTSIYLQKGEKLSMKELLYGLILASGNDSAVAIAEYFGG